MKKMNLYLAVGATCLTLGAGVGLAGINGYKSKEREERISELVAAFKERCNPVKTEQGCFYDPSALESSAKLHLSSGEPVKAGIVYARIEGKGDEARKIAEKCEKDGDKQCAAGIREELTARALAIERYFEDQRVPKSAPSGSSR